jgi:hypothetical protein
MADETAALVYSRIKKAREKNLPRFNCYKRQLGGHRYHRNFYASVFLSTRIRIVICNGHAFP